VTLRRVVVGVDSSPGADRALAWVADLARGSDTEIVVVHGWSGPEFAGQEQVVIDEATAYLRDEGIAARGVFEMTDPKEVLVAVAEREDADLIVVGSRGKNLVASLLLGSVGEYLVHHSPRPVVVVRHERGEKPG
jgi:nucleotide-binding universal stress UspA family protein